MSFATTIALLAIALFVLSQVQRRTERFDPLLPLIIRGLAIVVLALAAFYFYRRFTA